MVNQIGQATVADEWQWVKKLHQNTEYIIT